MSDLLDKVGSATSGVWKAIKTIISVLLLLFVVAVFWSMYHAGKVMDSVAEEHKVKAAQTATQVKPSGDQPAANNALPLTPPVDPVAEAASRKAELAKWKKEGVSIGMSAERVLLSSWGKPEKINRTTHKFGEREQWVYGSGNYLYFRNGILDSISTHE